MWVSPVSIDLYLQNNPNLLPRDEVRITHVEAAPYPDHRRVKIDVTTTPFRERPNLEITIRNDARKLVASSSAIGVMNFTVSFNLHLRHVADPTGEYVVQVQLYYDDLQSPQDTHEITLNIPAGEN